MRIAILSCFYPYRGGIAQFNAELYRELSKEHQVKAFNFSRQYPDFLFPGKTQYVTSDDRDEALESERILDTVNPFSYFRTVREIRRWKPDLLIMRYWMPFFAPSLGYVGRRLRRYCRVIAIVDNLIPHERHFFDRPLTSYFAGAADGFIALSDAVKKDIAALDPDLKCTVIPHPPYSRFGKRQERATAAETLGLDPGKKTLLFFGLIREYKGLDILIDAFGRLDDSYELVIAGEPYGSFRPYEEQIEASPNRERIHAFTSYIKDDDVSTFFSCADVVVLPYRTATQSGISAVSSHFEVPMITTDVGGLKEAIEGTGTGVVVREPDAGMIAGAIRDFFSGSTVSYTDAIRAEKEKISWSNFVKKLISFSESTIK